MSDSLRKTSARAPTLRSAFSADPHSLGDPGTVQKLFSGNDIAIVWHCEAAA
jgi:hypothetical protein